MEKQYLVLKELHGNPPPTLGPVQQMMEPHAGTITLFWFVLWICAGLTAIGQLIRELRHARNR